MADIPVTSLPDVTPAPTDRQMVVQADDELGLTPAVSAAAVDGKVSKAGDTMTGNLTIAGGFPQLVLNGTTQNYINFQDGNTGFSGYRIIYNIGTERIEFQHYDPTTGTLQNYPLLLESDGSVNMGLATSVTVPDLTATGEVTLAAASGINQLVLQSSSSDTRQFINFKDSVGTQQFIIWQDQAAKIFQITTEAALAGSRVVSMLIDETGSVDFLGAPSVTVPDLTATGVDVSDTNPTIVVDKTSGTADESRYAFRVNNDHFELISQTDAAATKAILVRANSSDGEISTHRFGPAGPVDMTRSTSVTVPDLTATGDVIVAATNAQLVVGGGGAGSKQVVFRDELDVNRITFTRFDSNDQFQLRQHDAAGAFERTPLQLLDSGELRLTGSTSVTVPDATADGEALAQGQAGAELAGLVSTGRVETSATQPEWRLIETDQPADQQMFRMYQSNGQVFMLFAADSSAPTQEVLRLTNAGQVVGHLATSITVPAAADGDTNTAAQTTDFDSTTGQAQVNGVEVGDTGWRDVSADLSDGWTASTFEIRRTGQTVHVRFNGLDGSASTGTSAFTNPTGFVNPAGLQAIVADTSSTSGQLNVDTTKIVMIAGGVWRVNAGTSDAVGLISFPTDDAWPATLPGTPA